MTDFTSRTIQASDCSIHVVEGGSGHPVLMLPDNIAGVAYSYRHLQRLLPRRRTIAMERLYKDIPNSEIAVIKDAGFLLFEEQPEAVAQALERFLERID